jgi:hypothetical protein
MGVDGGCVERGGSLSFRFGCWRGFGGAGEEGLGVVCVGGGEGGGGRVSGVEVDIDHFTR